MNRIYISAAHKSSGKTTVSIGLCAALAARGLTVQACKKGPDYIDPTWLGRASGRPCHNLDFYTQSDEEIRARFAHYGRDADISLVEGNKGLFDGLDLEGSNSNAALAKLLETPVVLVIDSRGTTRGVAPLLLGYQAFDRELRIAGVIYNQVGGARHEAKLRAVTEHYTDLPVIGCIQRSDEMAIDERHLGLIPSREAPEVDARIAQIAHAVGQQVDLERLLALAADTTPFDAPPLAAGMRSGRRVRIGIPLDRAFNFYYPGDWQALEAAGAELLFFDALRDPHLPAVDGLFIGGGFPETQMEALESNQSLRGEIRAAIEGGMPVYAECGGLMYLSRSITWGGSRREMVGVIPGDVVMHKRPIGRGYIRLEESGAGPWPLAEERAGERAVFPAHEFHHSSLENLPAGLTYAYRVLRGHGIDGEHDGLVINNTLACYAHLRDVAGNRWTERFVDFVQHCKGSRPAPPGPATRNDPVA